MGIDPVLGEQQLLSLRVRDTPQTRGKPSSAVPTVTSSGVCRAALQSRLDRFFLRPSSVFPRCPAGMRPMGVNPHRLATFLLSRQVLLVLARSAVAPLR
jgi:hypothetical protein